MVVGSPGCWPNGTEEGEGKALAMNRKGDSSETTNLDGGQRRRKEVAWRLLQASRRGLVAAPQ